MRKEIEYWDLGDVPSNTNQWPRMSDACLARILRALIELKGQWLDCYCENHNGYKPNQVPMNARISLPVGKRNAFEQITGFPLTEPNVIQVGMN
jgi:hypothetical protein